MMGLVLQRLVAACSPGLGTGTAVHLAAREGHARVLKALLHDCDDAMKEYLSNQRDVFGITPVFLSLQRGEESRAAFEYLMQCGGKYNSQSAIKFKPDLLAHNHASDSEQWTQQ
ncbi:ANK_REP_REGION domain-containing protein [Haematococcus lacustris]|uniref:ANK_REP_REGION domain-containing protein n=1 Tax=Haematococcus lacustris TaxID=44745 RepID=A0A6A0A1S7_HAELA|nr:ANK_REP_REGION domain-containing protein [Haematococcus lacustris]